MAKSYDGSWLKFRNFVSGRFSDVVSFVSLIIAAIGLIIAWVAMGYAHDSAVLGSTVEKQQHTIDTLKIVIDQLNSISFTQQFTNIALQKALDSQSRQITELKKLDITAFNQFKVAKESLDLVIADRSLSNDLDKTELSNGIRNVKSAMDDLTSYRRSPKKDADDIGAEFDYKISSIKNLVTALTTNRYVQSRRYELQNLFVLIDHIQQTHLVFQHYDHNYREVDAKIVDDFFGVWPAFEDMDNNDSSNNRLFKAEFGEAGYRMNHDADSVFKAGRYQ